MTINYKKTLFRYTPAKSLRESDNLVCQMDQLDYAGAYNKAYELFSAISFSERVQVKLGGGLTDVPMVRSIEEMNIGQAEHRLMPAFEQRLKIHELALARTDEQVTLLRLFRHAYSVNDPFTQLLFYWHTLVYPSDREHDAVSFVTMNAPLVKEDRALFRKDALRHQFSNLGTSQDLGEYVQKGVRHSIAHIRRDKNEYNSLDMDNLHQIWHVQYISGLLERLCRLRLERDFQIEIGTDPQIFCID